MWSPQKDVLKKPFYINLAGGLQLWPSSGGICLVLAIVDWDFPHSIFQTTGDSNLPVKFHFFMFIDAISIGNVFPLW